MKDTNEYGGDCDEEGVTQVSFTRPHGVRYCTSKKVQVCILPL